VRVVPVFNTGVMLLRNGLGNRIANLWSLFVSLARSFQLKALLYPCRNPHLLEEIVATLVMGGVPKATWKELPEHLAPFFLEYQGRHAATRGIVMHTFSSLYPPCLFDWFGAEELRRYDGLNAGIGRSILPRVRKAISAGWLLLGTRLLPLPSDLQASWARKAALVFPSHDRFHRRRQSQ
jgi:hypothetical protein